LSFVSVVIFRVRCVCNEGSKRGERVVSDRKLGCLYRRATY
jgi:hypothetical protein